MQIEIHNAIGIAQTFYQPAADKPCAAGNKNTFAAQRVQIFAGVLQHPVEINIGQGLGHG